jgi:hypothetical protein
MTGEYLSIAFEIIDLSNMAWMVTNSVNALTDDQKNLADVTKKLMDSFPEKVDFVGNTTSFQPLGLPIASKSYKNSLEEKRLVELAKAIKSNAAKDGSKESLLKANKILKMFEISNTYLKNREFFETRTASLNSSNPYGIFMA